MKEILLIIVHTYVCTYLLKYIPCSIEFHMTPIVKTIRPLVAHEINIKNNNQGSMQNLGSGGNENFQNLGGNGMRVLKQFRGFPKV